MVKRIIFGLLGIVALLAIWQFDLIRYGIRQASGQLSIIYNARPVEEYLNDPTVSDSVKMKLEFIGDVRAFAISNLHLSDTDNYTTMYDQGGMPVLWVVTGCEPYSFTPYEWKFPFLGSVPYKGFFKKEYADHEYEIIKSKGLDVGMRTVGGWSTLGWFKDPILSEMLDRDYGDLANLIIHELVHATIFVKDSIEFNENLASFIADKGTLIYMKERYGDSSVVYRQYIEEVEDEKTFVNHMLHGYNVLDSLYKKITDLSIVTKSSKKSLLINKVMNGLDTLTFNNNNYTERVKGYQPNNTYFMSFQRYQSKQGMLDSIYQKQFDQNLVNFILFLKDKHPSL
jgi:predicted aminopeptidase